MKTKFKAICSILLLCFIAKNAHSQFILTPATGGQCGRTTVPIAGVGIGTFPIGIPTRANLHINSFYTNNTSGFFPTGDLFRTDCQNTNLSIWHMFTGPTATTTTEKFALFNPAASNNMFLQSTQGDMFFNTAGPAPAFVVQERMHITSATGNLIGVQQPNATRVNISYAAGYTPIANPVALLNLGFDAP